MTVTPDDDFAAAEFALGTLDGGERASLAARRLREPDLDAAIRAWEERLAPLAEATPEVEPPAALFEAIAARIRAPAHVADLVALRSRLARWRAGAIAASVLSAFLAVGIVVRERQRSEAPRQYVAILQKDAESPAFAVTVDLDKLEFSVRPVAAHAPPGKAYELWLIELANRRAEVARRDRRRAQGRDARELSARSHRGRHLCGDRGAARWFADRPAVRPPCIRRQTDTGRALTPNSGCNDLTRRAGKCCPSPVT